MPEMKPGIEVTNPDAYKNKLFALLGDRIPLAVLSETPGVLSRIVGDTPTDLMKTRPFEGKWTANEIIGHLTDVEWVFGFRIRHILCEESPTIVGMDQNLWVSGQRHNDREPSELVDMFSGLRRFNLGIWRRVGPADLKRTGNHSERGAESLEAMLRMEAGHDLSHLGQIRRYLEACRAG